MVMLLRLRLAAGTLVAGGFVLAGILFLSGLFAKQALLGRLGVLALSISMLGEAISQAMSVLALRRSGSWRGLGGEQVSRDQQPVRFRVWLTTHVLVMSISLAAAIYFVTIAIPSSP
jgi:hypothetical protein